ncbi:hypothetical protein DEM27_09025 [Metarhizobium album]|uniref:Type II toxin-antitoxin system RelE/ParE family toxin n=2 Tax=Metarhizobium album TaxID=2182425 RepID=A0A2U2DT74_9HYPH|nr:hypothetical protein DEM27_09025 [Rhizobium album]
MLGDLPAIGQERDDIRPGIRTFPKGGYLILFRRDGAHAIIVRVVHGARHWPNLVRRNVGIEPFTKRNYILNHEAPDLDPGCGRRLGRWALQ